MYCWNFFFLYRFRVSGVRRISPAASANNFQQDRKNIFPVTGKETVPRDFYLARKSHFVKAHRVVS